MEIRDVQSISVVIGKSVKRISLQRYIVTKICLELEKISSRDIFTLYQNQIWLQDKCYREAEFSRKFGIPLEGLSMILKNLNLSTDFQTSKLVALRNRIKVELEDFIIPTRNYQSFKGRFEGTFHLIFSKPQGIPTKDLPPVRYIGVGYKDKGSASKPEFDGSPNWKDIASSAENILRIIDETRISIREGINGKQLTGVEKLQAVKYISSKRAEYNRLRRTPSSPKGLAKENKGLYKT
jgi:hypothetical protein